MLALCCADVSQESADSQAVIRLQEELDKRKETEGELRASLASALSEREQALRMASQSAGVITADKAYFQQEKAAKKGMTLNVPGTSVSVTVDDE